MESGERKPGRPWWMFWRRRTAQPSIPGNDSAFEVSASEVTSLARRFKPGASAANKRDDAMREIISVFVSDLKSDYLPKLVASFRSHTGANDSQITALIAGYV